MSGSPSHSVLVTGAAGFLGGWVTKAIEAAGGRAIGVDIDWSHDAGTGAGSRVDGDVRDRAGMRALIEREQVDTVIHLAAQSLVETATASPAETFDHNVRGTTELLEACREAGIVASIVVASSDKAYGDAAGTEYVESMPLAAVNPYDASKACADIAARSFAHSFDMPIGITRCGNLFGGGDRNESRLIPGTIDSVLRGERPVIRSDGTYVRDFLFVEDAASGVLLLADAVREQPNLHGEAFNLSGETRLSVLEAVEQILEALGSSLEPDIRNVARNEIREQRVSAAKARDLLAWKPETSFPEGIARTVAWHRERSAS